MIAINRPAIFLAISLALLLTCGSSPLAAQVCIEGRLLLDPEIPAERLVVRITSAPRKTRVFARAPVDAEGRFRAEIEAAPRVHLELETPGDWYNEILRDVALQPTGTTQIGDIDLRERVHRFRVEVRDPEGHFVNGATIRNVSNMHSCEVVAPYGVAEVVVAREEPRKCTVDALGFKAATIEDLAGDTTLILEMAPLLRVRLLHPAIFKGGVLPEGTRLVAVISRRSDFPARNSLDAPFINRVAEFELDGQHRYYLKIYIEGLEKLTSLDPFMRADPRMIDPWMFPELVRRGLIGIAGTTPTKIQVDGLRTEVVVTADSPMPRFLRHLGTPRLRLSPDLAQSTQGGKAPLWAALVPDGESVPDVEYLGDLPMLAGRFVNGVLQLAPLEAGRYHIRIYRVSPTWFTVQFPDRRLGRAAKVEGAQPRVIEVQGRLTEVEITAPAKPFQ